MSLLIGHFSFYFPNQDLTQQASIENLAYSLFKLFQKCAADKVENENDILKNYQRWHLFTTLQYLLSKITMFFKTKIKSR